MGETTPMKIDKDAPVPLYWQLAKLIKQQISSGAMKPGDRLPTEHWLAEQYGLSRVTVRKAIQYLIDSGVLVRNRGESPTIPLPHMSRQTNRLTSLSEDLRKMGYTPGSLILCCERVPTPPDVAELLGIKSGEPSFHLVRLRSADESPLAIHNCYYPLSICGKVLRPTFHAESVYRLLEENGIELAYARQTVSARNATDTEAAMLALPPKSALLHIIRISFTAEDVPVEYSEMLYNPVRYDLNIELRR